MLHHIQRRVINVLASKDPAHYADLKPPSMDGNQFTYHLKQLLANKMVCKNDDGTYSLTQKGRTYLVHRFENPEKSAHTIFLAIIRHDDKVLIRERKVQPMQGYAGFIHGEPSSDKPLEESVRERILAKTGLVIDNYKVHGSGLIRIMKDGQVQSYSHAIIVEATSATDELPIAEDETGKNLWMSDKDPKSVKNLPSNGDIFIYINDPASNWFDWTYEM